MTLSEIWAPAGAATMRAERTTAVVRAISIAWLLFEVAGVGRRSLYPKVFVQLVHLGREIRVRHHVHDAPVLHDVVTVGHRGREAEVLLHEQDGEPVGLEPPDGRPDLLHDHGREPLRGLVEQENARPRAKDPRDGEHLLL